MSIPTSSSSSIGSIPSGSIEISNPLFLNSSDNPSTILASKVFDGIGFAMWKRSIILALSTKNKTGSDDFSTYFTKIKRIWDELKTIHEIPNCSCGSTAAINKFLEEQRLVQLLMGLNDLFKAIKGQILMMSPLPSISTVHSLLIHEERQREISANPNLATDSMAMHVNNLTPNYQSSKKYCSNCKKIRHVKSQCYRLIGFPSDFKFTKSKKFESATHNVADNTLDNNQGISPNQYKQLIELLSKVNINEATCVNSVLTDGAMDTSGNFIDSHGNHVSYAFNVVMGSNQEQSTWIIDSGASGHICCDKLLFTTLNNFSRPHLIGLPNDQSIQVTQYGTLPIHDKIILSQAPLSRNKFIIGKRIKNLYIRNYKTLKNPTFVDNFSKYCMNCNKTDNNHLWHLLLFKPLSIKPDLNNLRSFGCRCYASTNSHNRDKFQPRADTCIFVGYPFGQKGYKVLNLNNKGISVTRNVVFVEDKFPLRNGYIFDSSYFSAVFEEPSQSLNETQPSFSSNDQFIESMIIFLNHLNHLNKILLNLNPSYEEQPEYLSNLPS
ncbi:uncharacterized protein LOC111893020 [Lactuca sativa]|uniref:uncharacterized protein LOC111893020 n=1 Tax=Lactuca sativa TaxID=4236 RepID=UPI001C68A198|nr:uncharacterized protein LOC111893020 [Lactuca sativa]